MSARAAAVWGACGLVLATAPACEVFNAASDLDRFAGRDEAFWYAGDIHVHSDRTADAGTTSTPAAIKEAAVAAGLRFVVMLDKSSSTGSLELCSTEERQTECSARAGDSDRCTCIEESSRFNLGPEFPYLEEAKSLTDNGTLLMADASEISLASVTDPVSGEATAPAGHVGCLGLSGSFISDGPFRDRPAGEVSGRDAVQQCVQRNGLSFVAHPFAQTIDLRYDWTSLEYSGIEVYNGTDAWNVEDEAALGAWACQISAFHFEEAKFSETADPADPCQPPLRTWTVPLAGSNNRHPSMRFSFADSEGEIAGREMGVGQPRMSILSPQLTWGNVGEGVCRGRVVLHDSGAFIDYKLYNGDGQYIGSVGDTVAADAGDTLFMRVRATATGASVAQLMFVADDRCRDNLALAGEVNPGIDSYFVAVTADAAIQRYSRTMDLEETRAVCAQSSGCSDEWITTLDVERSGFYFWRMISEQDEAFAIAGARKAKLDPSNPAVVARFRRPSQGVVITNAIRVDLGE